jgi:hypothetical protein
MFNAFRYTGVNYFQFPEAVVDDKIATLSLHDSKLYLLILRLALQMSNSVVRIITKEAIHILNMRTTATISEPEAEWLQRMIGL